MTLTCDWCGQPFAVRQSGHPQRFCSPAHRRSLHEAARGWALAELAAGRLTVEQIKNGLPVSPPPLGTQVKAPPPEEAEAAELLDEILGALDDKQLIDGLLPMLPEETMNRVINYLTPEPAAADSVSL